MPELNAANVEQVIQTCQANLGAIGQCLNQCFDTTFRLSLGELQPVSGLGDVGDLSGPGLVVGFEVGTTSMLCAIPECLPLPAWYRKPDKTQSSRLETLAQEWAFNFLPDDLPGDNFVSRVAASLWTYITSAVPADDAVCQPLLVETTAGGRQTRMCLVWPVARIPACTTVPEQSDSGKSGTGTGPSPPSMSGSAEMATVAPTGPVNPIVRLQNLPVPVIVKLAEKKIELGQLIGIGPGAIITFEKPCEDLLDLYVNNQLFCRGEAVKIGEKFGIKICETGSVHSRSSTLLTTNSRSG